MKYVMSSMGGSFGIKIVSKKICITFEPKACLLTYSKCIHLCFAPVND